MAGIDISLNLQDNDIIGWQLHLYMLIEGENTLRLREAIKAAFPPERTAPMPYDFDEVKCGNSTSQPRSACNLSIFIRDFRNRHSVGEGR